MINVLKRDLEAGVEKLKWFASLLSERVRIEIEVFKLLYKSEELKKKRDELLRRIGQEVYDARNKERNIYAIKDVADAIKELEALEPEIREKIERASEISRASL